MAKHAKKIEFEHLIQGTMTVLEYESHFSELSKFVVGIISEERGESKEVPTGVEAYHQD